ncbi:MAG: sigma 54-interacting transcriptional regulator, partial [Erysipelotrichales bacterium]|nr:sigma 54-interacting transcriptional regulator [Erysipelotrichales bacterium]
MNRIDKIHEEVKKNTIRLINEYKIDDSGISALEVSLDLKLDRANVSKDLNTLWKNDMIIKIQSHPVLFLDREELLKAYSINYLPNLITKNEKLSNYLVADNTNNTKVNDSTDSIDSIIGARDTLSLQIKKAKAAISYPPIGLHTLIHGSSGVGKWKFANHMYDYGVNHGRKKSNSKFIRIDCQYFSDSTSNFNISIFGAAKVATNTSIEKYRKVLIEECNSGV